MYLNGIYTIEQAAHERIAERLHEANLSRMLRNARGGPERAPQPFVSGKALLLGQIMRTSRQVHLARRFVRFGPLEISW